MDPFIGEIRMFGGNFAPRDWAFCDGQLLQVNQFDALFSLLGTIYGGDGRTTFGLPDLRGRIPVHAGTGPGLNLRRLGERGGAETHTLNVNQIPSHTHAVRAVQNPAGRNDPSGAYPAQPAHNLYGTPANMMAMQSDAVSNSGGSQSHNNIQPFQCVNFIIALFGIYPSRT